MTLRTGTCAALSPIGEGPARRTATFSPCGRYRYQLFIREPRGLGAVTFVMLNPSTADEMKDDPTVRRCRGFAVRWGFRDVWIVNLFAWRATDPTSLYEASDPVGPDNDQAIVKAAEISQRVVVAWGTHGGLMNRGEDVSILLYRSQLLCLGRTKDGSPKHPLYLAADTKPEDWRRP